ncbi:MAG: LVIVD repeat-containing protein [Candidatus Thorarchaeota archaeon]
MKTRVVTAICILALFLIVNSGSFRFVSGASTNEIMLTRVGLVETGDAYDVWVDTDNDIAYVTCGYSGVKIFDIRNPYNPVELASVPASASGYAHQFVMSGNLMLIGDGSGGLKIIDCTNSSNPDVLTQFTGDYAWAVEVEGETAFVANGFMGGGDRLTIVNITDPTTPALLGSQTTVGDSTDIEVVENLAFATTSYAGFTVFDVSNLTNPVQIGDYTGQSTSNAELGDLEIVGDLAYLSYWEQSFKVLNISDLSNIGVVAEFTESLSAFSVHIEIDSSLAFLCDHEIGLVVLDISIPTQLTEIGRYFDGGKPCRVQVVDNLVYMTDADNGFVILEIGENYAPTIGFELVLLVGGVAAILALGWWLKRRRP